MVNTTSWVFSILELLLLVALFFILKDPIRLLLTGHRTGGTVIGIDSHLLDRNPNAEPLLLPVVEFYTTAGKKVTVKARNYIESNSTKVGDSVTLLYNSADPEDAQILSWTQLPVMLFVFTFGFAMLILFFWIVLIISEGHSYDDPIHLLPKLISQFHLNRLHFPVMFFLLLIPMIFGMVTFSLIKDGLDLRANGVKVIGHVTVSREQTTTSLSDNRTSIGTYMWISFKDASGKEYTIRRSLARPFTHLKPGEAVEVIYPANRPDTAVVNVWDELFLAPLFIGFIVVAFLYLPWMYYRARN